MAEYSKIAWTDHTFNPWIGCTKVSDGCKECYAAELMEVRYQKAKWGPTAKRIKTSAAYWRKPLAWNNRRFMECQVCGFRGNDIGQALCPQCLHPTLRVWTPARQRVFCASLADVFEDNHQLANWRGELFQLIDQTPNLDWLILTKRPEKIFSLGTDAVGEIFDLWLDRHKNVWLGTSVEDQKTWDERVVHLGNIAAEVNFVSIEPMLAPVHVRTSYSWMKPNWIIVGGESGPRARTMNIEWARAVRDDCKEQGIRFFMKQLGGRTDKRDDLIDLPEDLQIREYPL